MKLINKFIKVYSEYIYIPICALLCSEVILCLFKSNIIMLAILNLLSFVLFVFSKDAFSDQKFKTVFILIRISVILAIFDFGITILRILSEKLNKPLPIVLVAMLGVVVVSSGFYVLFSKNQEKEETIKNLKSPSFDYEESKKTDDLNIRLCRDKDTGQDIHIPLKDRFLHMLIIGPTGCGKTSQILIPMIWQDMQKEGCGVTVMEPKGDLAEIVYAMGEVTKKEVIYFNPANPDCPYFNPLYGKEEDVIENMATTFKMLAPDSKAYFQDIADVVVRNSIKVIKRLEFSGMNKKTGISSEPATLIRLNTLIQNTNGEGRKMIIAFQKLGGTPDMKKENTDIAAWFLDEYYNEKSKIHENSSGTRTQLTKITSNKFLRRVLNPPNGVSDIKFDEILASGGHLAISTAQGELRDLTSYLGFFIILSFQSAVFKRPGPERKRIPHFFYVDEFQKYSNPGFSDMLTQGRSYRVATHMATQARSQMAMGGGKDGERFVQLVSTNARNIVVFPGVSTDDAKYYSAEFGEVTEQVIRRGTSHQKFNLAYGLKSMNYPTETENISEETKAKYSYSDIIYRDPGEITYRTINKMKVMPAGVGLISYIDSDLNDKLSKIAEDYKEMQIEKINQIEEEELKGSKSSEVNNSNDNYNNSSDDDDEQLDDLI